MKGEFNDEKVDNGEGPRLVAQVLLEVVLGRKLSAVGNGQR